MAITPKKKALQKKNKIKSGKEEIAKPEPNKKNIKFKKEQIVKDIPKKK